MACRNITKAEAAKTEIEKLTATLQGNGTLTIEILDLCSLTSVKEFVKRILAIEKNLNILVNNAGVMMCPQGKTEDSFETHMGSNHFGHALLTFMLLPIMVRSAPSRIVNVSSCLHKCFVLPLDDINFERPPYEPFKAYCRSKTANVLFSKSLAQKLKVCQHVTYNLDHKNTNRFDDFCDCNQEHNIQGVTTYSLHPGVIRTDISRHFDKTMWFGATWSFNHILSWFVKSRKCGAQTTIYCAVDEACADQSGLYYSDCAPTVPTKQCQDEETVNNFWSLTVNSLNYNPFTQENFTLECAVQSQTTAQPCPALSFPTELRRGKV